jgi:hypothetical protein
MADMFDDMHMDNDKGQQVKSNEITGERFQFHSLPKEFQDWHNNYYILEKQGEIDKNSVSKAILNGYMWQTITDGTNYGIATAIATIAAIIKWKLTGGVLGFLFSAIFFYPFLLFVAYHFIFYAMIRAQVIGPVTKGSANVTTYTFYTTFFGLYLSIIAVFIFMIALAKDIVLFLFMLIVELHMKTINGQQLNAIQQYFEDFFIWLHNFIIEVFIIQPDNFFESIYFMTILMTLSSIGIFFFFEKQNFKKREKDIQEELAKHKLAQGYPIETAQKIMTEWREQNGM